MAFLTCSYELAIKNVTSPWCSLFSEEDAKVGVKCRGQRDLRNLQNMPHCLDVVLWAVVSSVPVLQPSLGLALH